MVLGFGRPDKTAHRGAGHRRPRPRQVDGAAQRVPEPGPRARPMAVGYSPGRGFRVPIQVVATPKVSGDNAEGSWAALPGHWTWTPGPTWPWSAAAGPSAPGPAIRSQGSPWRYRRHAARGPPPWPPYPDADLTDNPGEPQSAVEAKATMFKRMIEGLHTSKLDNLATTFRRLGRVGFWLQVVLGSIPVLLMFYVFVFSGQTTGPRAGLADRRIPDHRQPADAPFHHLLVPSLHSPCQDHRRSRVQHHRVGSAGQGLDRSGGKQRGSLLLDAGDAGSRWGNSCSNSSPLPRGAFRPSRPSQAPPPVGCRRSIW